MILVYPSIEVENYNGLQIMKNIERAMRTCYRTEGSITEDSYKRLLKMSVESGHGSVMEHEKITIRMQCSLNTYKDITRHRVGTAFSIESTRWCNYSKDKFNKNLRFIKPAYINDMNMYMLWKNCMLNIEETYMKMAAAGAKPDELRTILPHSTAAEVTMTCNIREWIHILSLRTTKNVHPEIRQLFIPLLLKFKEDMPELFGQIKYDETFPKEWYAEIKELKNYK